MLDCNVARAIVAVHRQREADAIILELLRRARTKLEARDLSGAREQLSEVQGAIAALNRCALFPGPKVTQYLEVISFAVHRGFL